MSLLSILSNATNALLNSQAQINVVSSNIGNAQNPNYSQRSAVVIDKTQQNGGGNEVVDVQRAVDGTLQANYLNNVTDSAAKTTINQLYTQLEQLTGSSTNSPVLTSAMQAFQNAWQALQATPEDKTTQQQVITSAQSLVQTLQTVAHGVAKLQSQVKTQLGTDVNTLNTSLSQIATLNAQIASGKHAGQDTTSLQDARDQLITTVAGLVPIQQQQNSDGTVYLTTPSGVALVQQNATSFSYDATSDTFYATNDPNKTSLNGALTSGQIGAEIGILASDPTGINQINAFVGAVNSPLAQLGALNATIAANYAATPSVPATAAQVAQQAADVAAIQAQLPTATVVTTNTNGTVSVSTPAGLQLTTATSFNQLAYDPTSNTIYDQSSGTSINSLLPPASTSPATTASSAAAGLQSVAATTSGGPGAAPLFQLTNQLNSIADLFYSSTGSTAFQTAYDNASPTNAGELASSFFTFGGNASGTSSDVFNLQVNSALVNGTSTVKQAAAITVATEFTSGPTAYTALSQVNAAASDQSGRAAQATSDQTTAAANTTAAQQAYRNVTGVSTDQQLAQLVALQNAYSAAAKIISTVQELETTLLTAVGGA
ncbi:flagellar hook-associated protein FlgK [Aliidongia dinghuensis]|uniref:Flagellar hook-associated protein 1 n=1 Tax=Aliidongia dinghuensis TaxID=1867774 RepID=A0A8J2YU55_9PROT|nr:flagellar basal body rod C-terminal domain-containing protein [Aliidongia dinghuensis]GGF21478.1 flagellar hook-associated protein FlgK [Aliidongia dinghuensis]